ncbi:transglycosylase family protein [Kitasatospora sp. NPDC096147]|uniref:transglycosylase family protein n=1 Tax=Kitasatospora sp. NPDC096147 TaxID=3364093 RepID=UPI003819C3C3
MTFRHETTAATTTSSAKRNRLRMVLIGGAVAALPAAGLVTATSASAASSSTWDAVAQCESTGNWNTNTGNGFSGGLQFTPSTWAAYGGTQYAGSADQATKGQQIAVAEKVLQGQGPGAWPVCSVKAGLTKGGTPAQTDTSAASTPAKSTKTAKSADQTTKATPKNDTQAATRSTERTPVTKTTPAAPTQQNTGDSYTVKSGDTLAAIAATNGVDLQTLYTNNASVIGDDIDLILPGQVLSI